MYDLDFNFEAHMNFNESTYYRLKNNAKVSFKISWLD